MTTENSPRLGLDYVLAAQAQKHVTVNESFRRLDALVQSIAISRSLEAQPAAPAEGDAYILPAQASGTDWALMAEHALAVYRDAEWAEITPQAGWRLWVSDEGRILIFDGTEWSALDASLSELQSLALLGIGTSADSANPFAARLNAALWTALTGGEGGTGDLRCSLNKEAAGNVLALLFQTAYAGRAELGLLGDDDFSLKLSADGALWQEVWRARPDRFDIPVERGLFVGSINGAAPGARRNRIINGEFGIAQRGNGFPSAAAGDRLLDGWKLASGGGMSHDISRQDFPPGQADIPGTPRHYLAWSLVGTAAGYPALEQRIEGVDCLPEGDAVLTFYAKADRAVALTATLRRHFGTGGSPSDVLVQETRTLSLGWTRHAVSVPVAGLTGKTLGSGHSLALELNLQDGETAVDIALADIQLEPGDTATFFERLSPTEALQLCQRFFAKTYPPDVAPGSIGSAGALQAATCGPANSAVFDWRLPVTMRATPSVAIHSPATGTAGLIDATGTALSASVLAASENAITLQSAAHAGLDLAAAHLVASAEL